MTPKWGVIGTLVGLVLSVIVIQQGAAGLAIPFSAAAGVCATLAVQRWQQWG